MLKLSGSTNSLCDPPHLVNFDLPSESYVDTANFNPLHQFDHLGKKKLDQVCQAFLGYYYYYYIIITAYSGRKSFIYN